MKDTRLIEGRNPLRLIEVDLPIKRISEHARREKSIRHGHISTLHIWWARRPLAACRAIICAALWPDPADALCPQSFIQIARERMLAWAQRHAELAGEESFKQLLLIRKDPSALDNLLEVRRALLNFIADFANWDNSAVEEYLDTSRALTLAAHKALGGEPGTRPLVVDPFAGGGSIPLEALRIGADAFASDLNPIPVLLNKVALEYIPRYGQRLADEVRKWGDWVQRRAERELGEFYPLDDDGSQPAAYLWARTAKCEGPSCGATVPIFTNDLLAKRKSGDVRLRLEISAEGKITTRITIDKSAAERAKTVFRGAIVCPVCGFTTPAENVRRQFKGRRGGTADAFLLAVVATKPNSGQRVYRQPRDRDLAAVQRACDRLSKIPPTSDGISTLPEEALPYLRSIFNINLLDVSRWRDLFTPRQLLLLITFIQIIHEIPDLTGDMAEALVTCLALAIDKMADFHSTLAAWINVGEKIGHTFGRQALGIIWDYAEANPFADISGAWSRCTDYIAKFIEANTVLGVQGHISRASATANPLPDDSAQALVTDPPYYDAVPYADLSDFFYVWLRRSVRRIHPHLFDAELSPKRDEIVQLSERNPAYGFKTRENFEKLMMDAMAESRRVLCPSGIGIVVFAHKTTVGWEAQLQAMLSAGWIVTASWPIDTERPGRLRAMNSAVLASSIHLVCRPREHFDGSLNINRIGYWRDILQELPRRIHEWMPRLAREGVVGADAIFACLGPALEIFSRYHRVEKASGEEVTLHDYLEQVWAVVAREALSTVISDADSGSLEPDARLTVIWLWTLGGGAREDGAATEEDDSEDDEGGSAIVGTFSSGFILEYDAARKIAQGLGARLEELTYTVEVKGDKARLLAVAERAQHLFGKHEGVPTGRRSPRKKQIALFADLEEAVEAQDWGEVGAPKTGSTILDRVHQAMLLFASGRGEALKRFLVEEGVGRQAPFWSLAQSLSALYPVGSDEKRWVDGVLARKKGLGFG